MPGQRVSERREVPEHGELFRLIVECATDYAIFTTDCERRVTSWNVGAERMMGWSDEEFIGRSADDIFIAEDRERGEPAKEAQKALENGRAENRRWHQRKDGSRFWGDGIMAPLRDERQKIRGFVKIFRDRTADRKVEEERREGERRKDEFLAILAHELRNPLAAISNASRLLQSAHVNERSVKWSKDVIARQVESLSRMIDDLLDVSRINTGKVHLTREVVNIGPVIARSIQSVSHMIEEKKHVLGVQIASSPLRALGDRIRLEQIVSNLLSNAAKYTDPGGRIEVIAAPSGDDSIVISVRDNGVGLSPEMCSKIFELFAQVDKSLDRSKGGLGIGLSVVKRLVEMHGGTVSVESRGPGRGSEFSVRLPSYKDGTVTAPDVRAGPRSACVRRRILVVDDNVDSAVGLAELLRMAGHQVTVVHDGEAALRAAKSIRPDVVLLDIGLPGLNGYEVAERLTGEHAPHSLLIGISGYTQPEDCRRAAGAGFDHYLSKPVPVDALLTIIERECSGLDSERALE